MPDQKQRFAALARVLGDDAPALLQQAHICVVGVGGVGSWAAEAAARNGFGRITLIDDDDIAESNSNRQLHTLQSTLGQAKVAVMRERLQDINPDCECRALDDRVSQANLQKFHWQQFDYVIDAIDRVGAKTALMQHCHRNKIPLVSTGGAGGRSDPTQIQINDLNRCFNDPLLAKVRSNLRYFHGYSSNPKRRYGIDCVFSTEQCLYPDGQGGVSQARPKNSGAGLDCQIGLGSLVTVTAVFGFNSVALATRKYLKKRRTI